MKMIITHRNVDLDACTSVALVSLSSPADFEAVAFVGADAKKEDLPEGAVCVDIEAGIKGIIDADGTRHSAAYALGSKERLGEAWAADIDEQDSKGRILAPRVGIGQVFSALREGLKLQGVQGDALDPKLVEVWEVIIRGAASLHQKSQIDTTEGLPRLTLPGGHTYIVAASGGLIANEDLQKHGFTGKIYKEGFNMGMANSPLAVNPPKLHEVFQGPHALPGWFLHSGGFLASWGSFKAPKTEPCPEVPTLEAFLERAKAAFAHAFPS